MLIWFSLFLFFVFLIVYVLVLDKLQIDFLQQLPSYIGGIAGGL